MPMLSGFQCAIMLDVLIRVSVIVTAGLLLTLTAGGNAALRHAILVAGLAAAFIVPVAMLTMQVLPVSRLELDLLGWARLDNSAAVAADSARPPSNPHYPAASPDHPEPAIVPTAEDKARPSLEAIESARLVVRPLEPRSVYWWETIPDERFMVNALFWALIMGAIVKVTGLGLSLLRLQRIVARARPVGSDDILTMLGLVQERIPMRHTPRLLESAEVSAPVAAGVIGDYVLLPTGSAGRLCRHEMLAVLCHESAHLARRDHYVVILQEVFASVLWFHPLVHLFNRMLNRAREEVCDNYAITMVERPAYCAALLHLAVGRRGRSARGATSMWSRHWSLEDRIRGILNEERPTKIRISGLARSATVTFTVAICGLLAMPELTALETGDRSEATADAATSPRAVAGPAANEMTRRIIKYFPMDGAKMIRFENLAGRVELVPGKGTAVEVEAIVRVGDLGVEDAKRLIDDIRWADVPTADGKSRLGLAIPDGRYPVVRYPVAGETKTESTTIRYLDREIRLSNRRAESVPSVEFDLRISVPPAAHVAVRNIVGPIESQNVVAPLDLTTHHGVIKLDDVRAPILVTSKLGDILISRLKGDAVVQTMSGNIELRQVTGGQVALAMHSGDCHIVLHPDTGFHLQYSGNRPILVNGGSVSRINTHVDDRHMELLSRGTGGPAITVTAGSGETVIESGP
jgi:beta-lactamase regulating signal transducer with metallopeptidase domain